MTKSKIKNKIKIKATDLKLLLPMSLKNKDTKLI